MRIPLRWLAEWVDLPDSRAELEERLTLGGLEIEGVEQRGPDLSALVVGEVRERGAHPNADRLSLCRVDVGAGEPLQIVCGAPNVAAGQKVAVARPGSELPDGTRIARARIRGVASEGMICSERELGLGQGHEGILVLPSESRVGASVAEVLGGGESVLDVEITPNRGDWVSMLGIAREVRAHFGGALRLPPCEPPEGTRPAERDIRVEIDDRAGCHHYVARIVRGIRVGPSPDWLRDRLESAGLRSLNAVVDVTNLVLLEFGQPIHAFDLSTLQGGEIRVRSARDGERLETLDGRVHTLADPDLVIADRDRAVALAGVMGGAETEVRDHTTDVLIESAHFHPSRVRRTARRLGLSTEASYRFERGVDREGIRRAADRAARLLAEIAGGEVSAGVVEAFGAPAPFTESVRLEPARVNRLLGIELSSQEIESLLERADLAPEREADGGLRCRAPSWRNDIERPEDLIEEVARLWGYDRLPPRLPRGDLAPVPVSRRRQLEEGARDSLCAAGLCEAITFPGLRADDLDRLRLPGDDPRRRLVRILNPLLGEDAHLWSLLVPGLLRVARHNRTHQVDEVRVFSLAHVFQARGAGELPEEPFLAAGLITRSPHARLWAPPDGAPIFFAMKGIAERLLEDLGFEASFRSGAPEPYLHPGAANQICVGDVAVGAVGELHPEVSQAFDLRDPCALLELDLSRLERLPPRRIAYREVSRQPRMRRDLALLLDRAQPAAEVLEAIRKTAGPVLVAVELFDRYEGKGIPEEKVSLAIRLDFQLPDRTLQEAEVNRLMDRVVQMVSHRFGGEQR